MCKPRILSLEETKGEPVLNIEGVRHPCVAAQKKFIPNTVRMGGQDPLAKLITGPNMGGKSTLLRSTCLAVIMAQVGCFVPADVCEMTVVDRIFTRIGASDRILENKSTFFVEMEETKTLVEQATQHSLVIVDELGRGTSTFDGFAIAKSVLSHLVDTVKARTLFTTHYHMMIDVFKGNPKVEAMQMACEIDEEGNVTFLYKFVPGAADQSQGIFVAKMAKVFDSVLKRAQEKSDIF